MKIIRSRLVPFKGYNAINLLGILFCRKGVELTPSLLNHERIHTRQMVEMLEQCVEVGYAAVMSGFAYQSGDGAVEDPVSVPDVNLEAYDSLFEKGAAVS